MKQCVVVYFILARADALLGAPCARFRRRGSPSWAQPPPSGDGLFGALAAFFRPPADFELSPAAAVVVDELCREDGWDVELELGSLPARAAGGTGTLVRSSQASPTVVLAARAEGPRAGRPRPASPASIRGSPDASRRLGPLPKPPRSRPLRARVVVVVSRRCSRSLRGSGRGILLPPPVYIFREGRCH